MSLFKPSELHQFLKMLDIQPKKGLSQNFLIDGNVLRKMVAAANLTEGDTVLEIGPGPGVLTEALLDAGAEVFAIEKDEKLVWCCSCSPFLRGARSILLGLGA